MSLAGRLHKEAAYCFKQLRDIFMKTAKSKNTEYLADECKAMKNEFNPTMTPEEAAKLVKELIDKFAAADIQYVIFSVVCGQEAEKKPYGLTSYGSLGSLATLVPAMRTGIDGLMESKNEVTRTLWELAIIPSAKKASLRRMLEHLTDDCDCGHDDEEEPTDENKAGAEKA